jgi:transcription-repair coupling factor (superfamily II helicase)
MGWVLTALDDWAEMHEIEERLRQASLIRVDGVIDPLKALIIARLARASDRPVVVIAPDGDAADRVVQQIQALWSDVAAAEDDPKVLLLPSSDTLIYEDTAPDPSQVGEKLSALRMLLGGEAEIVVASAAAAFQRTLPRETLAPAAISLRAGESRSMEELLERLVALGYEREAMVEAPGQFTVRGGIVDIYPAGGVYPVRVEFFGDEVDSLRRFDPASQLSVGSLHSVALVPAREVILSDEAADRALPLLEVALEEQVARLREAGRETEAARLEDQISRVRDGLRQRTYPRGLEYLLPFLYDEFTTLLDYVPGDSIIVVEEPSRLAEEYEEYLRDMQEMSQARMAHGLLLPLPGPLHLSCEAAQQALARHPVLEMSLLGVATGREPSWQLTVASQPVEHFAGDMEGFARDLRRRQREGERVLIASRQVDRLIEILDEAGVGAMVRESAGLQPKGGQLVLSARLLSEGFALPGARLTAITDREIFGWRKIYRPARRRAAGGMAIGSLTDLKPGDFVVHINHGVGIYRGLVQRGLPGSEREYLLIEYAGDDRLYVPTDQFDRVQKYLGGEGERPAIHRLGGSEWERTKRKAKKSAQELAGQLIKLYSARREQPGHVFAPDTPWQREMEDGFPYEETPDQLQSIAEVKHDMEQPQPMDRLVCGDVGYGKTEVAIRAAFKAVMDGRQVALLVPTTVLAQQHFTTFQERMAPYPVKVELLSRFRTKKEQDRVVADLAAGVVDIAIGTHRLLSKDVHFKDLGLLVVDEEQRFGVRHKERLKQLRTQVDALTLTATPIPRTLHMALSGIRDMSAMNDPPEGRMPVITRAVERDDRIIRDAITRELERGGQVFYVHNRIESIYHVADHVQRLVPQARITVAHGQMEERELERAMLSFYGGESQVLVSTTIIENGVDIPNANTMVISDADHLGLAQLYQLRGRIGRSDRQAYCYLMWTPFKRLTETAEKRIAAVREFSELGSGFKIALRDLEIRGAGNLLGAEQHGFVTAVGFELYMQMLSDAVQEAKGEPVEARLQVSVELPVDAYLPTDYAPDLNQRIDLYKRLAGVTNERRVDAMAEEITDRFGRPLPVPVQNLLRLARLKARAAAAGVQSIIMEGKLAVLRLREDRRLTPQLIQQLQRQLPSKVRLWLAQAAHDRVLVSLRAADAEATFTRVEQTLVELSRLPLDEEAQRHRRRMELVGG